MAARISRRAIIGAGAGLSLLSLMPRTARAAVAAPIIDTHLHLSRGLHRRESLGPAVTVALKAMDAHGVERAIVTPPPFPPGHPGLYGISEITAAIRGQKRFAFMAGGDTLNPLLQAIAAASVTDDAVKRFTAAAERIAAAGAAGFGELAAEHFSSGRGNHPYESAPPDHPLLLALADVAARHGMPIELHMEAVQQDMPFPPNRKQPADPAALLANIARLETLLGHNAQARIVWVHAGWDLTGERTPALMRSLLERHANLFMSVKIAASGTPMTAPFLAGGSTIRPGWIEMLRAFPERFVIGSDQFIDEGEELLDAARRFVDALPADLQAAIANGNAPVARS